MATETLLVTGANGFIAQHIIKFALERGYAIRGTGRSDATLAKLKATFPDYADKISFALVKDMTVTESYANAFDGISGVIHTASPFILNPTDNVVDILDPAVKGSVTILNAAARYGSQVRRVVNTSSFAAIFDFPLGLRPGYTYSEKDWNPMTWDEAAKADGVTAYCASKGLAEHAMWEWMEKNKPTFTLTSIDPPWVFGPSVSDNLDLKHLNESTHAIWNIIDAKEVPSFDFGGFVDVRTIAQALVLSYESAAAAGERFLVGSQFNYQTAIAGLLKEMPEIASRLPTPGEAPAQYAVDGSKAEKVLGIKYIPLATTMKDTVSQLLKAEAAA